MHSVVAFASLSAAIANMSCYRPTFVNCSVLCGAESECPVDSSCGADGFCHTPDTLGEMCIASPNDGGPNGDGGIPPGPCDPPILIAALESFTGQGGRILRFSLAGTEATRCTDLTGSGTLPDQPLAIAWVPPNLVAAATRSAVVLIDADIDAVVWLSSFDVTKNPVDAVVLEDGPLMRLGVGLRNPATVDDLSPVEIVDLADGTPIDSFDPGQSTRSVGRNPRDPSYFLRLRPGSFAAAEVNPFSGDRLEAPPYVVEPSGTLFHAVHASFEQPPRLAWAGTRLSDGQQAVYYLNDQTGGGSDLVPLGPVRCEAIARDYLHVVPDPTLNTRFVALTELDGERSILRFTSSGGPCETVLVGSTLGPNTRISRLAVIESMQ